MLNVDFFQNDCHTVPSPSLLSDLMFVPPPLTSIVINYLSCATTTLYQLLYVLYYCGSVLREVDMLNLGSVQRVGAYHCIMEFRLLP